MLADSVMSHWHSRFLNWLNGSEAFEISKRDLVNFPLLKDSHNYYWPTVCRPILGVGDKAYSSYEEVHAFESLKDDDEFNQFKWQSFYKHILIPPSLIEHALQKHLDKDSSEDRAQISLITQSVVARQAKLRAVLFSIPLFREYVSSIDSKAQQMMIETIVQDENAPDASTLSKEISDTMMYHQALCKPVGGFTEGDTPLHVAIRLQDYRYYDTWQAFGHLVNDENSMHQTPLDIAVEMAKQPVKKMDDVRADPLCTMKHLLREGAHKTDSYKQLTKESPIHLSDYLFHSGYPTKARTLANITQLKNFLRVIGEDHRYSLKMQKELAVICVRQFIKQHHNHPLLAQMMHQFHIELNGTPHKQPAPELQYIRQLRSQLWIIRIWRGLLGGTSTMVQLNDLVSKELKRLHVPEPCCWSFFSCRKNIDLEEPIEEEENIGQKPK